MAISIIPQFQSVLAANFMYWQSFAEAASLSLASGFPLAVTGSGGNAKSAMMGALLECFAPGVSQWVHSLHEEFSADDVFGGLNFAALTRADNPAKEYMIDDSMFMSHVSVLEEGFDARPRAISAMKDTMTSGKIRMGKKQITVENKWMVVLSNRSTAELDEMGPAIEAFSQRFLTLEQEDPFQNGDEISQLLRCAQEANIKPPAGLITLADIEKLQGHTQQVWVGEEVQKILASLMQTAREGGNAISPRSMVRAQILMKAAAALADRAEASTEDLCAIAFISGTQNVIQELDREIERKRALTLAEGSFATMQAQYNHLHNEFLNASYPQTPIRFIKITKQLKTLEQELGNLTCPDSLTSKRNEIRKAVGELISKAQDRALEVTNV